LKLNAIEASLVECVTGGMRVSHDRFGYLELKDERVKLRTD